MIETNDIAELKALIVSLQVRFNAYALKMKNSKHDWPKRPLVLTSRPLRMA